MSEKKERLRAWVTDELAFKDFEHLAKSVTLSDQLEDELWAKLFGRHPGVQQLTIAGMAARWITNHPPEVRDTATKQIITAIRGLAKIDRFHKGEKILND